MVSNDMNTDPFNSIPTPVNMRQAVRAGSISEADFERYTQLLKSRISQLQHKQRNQGLTDQEAELVERLITSLSDAGLWHIRGRSSLPEFRTQYTQEVSEINEMPESESQGVMEYVFENPEAITITTDQDTVVRHTPMYRERGL